MKRGQLHFSGFATFCGMQDAFRMERGEYRTAGQIELWNLTVGFDGHPIGSTVSRETLEGIIADEIERLRCRIAALEIQKSGELESVLLPAPDYPEHFAKIEDPAHHGFHD